jgi:hypothetical protein
MIWVTFGRRGREKLVILKLLQLLRLKILVEASREIAGNIDASGTDGRCRVFYGQYPVNAGRAKV